MTLKNKKILVTGADGFIGSHLVERLISKGAKVKAFVYYNSFNSWGWLDSLPKETLRKIEVFTGDIRDPNGVLTAMQGVDMVFHLAALIGIPFSYHSPDSYVDTNIKGTLNVLQAARQLKVEKVLHTSTSEIYGTAQYVPINESHPVNPQSPYAATKSAADQLALSFYRSFATPVTIVRPFNTFGPRQSARAVIPTIITQLYAGEKIIKLGNLEATRDFTYVTDTADAFITLAQEKNTEGQIFNVGNNQEISVGDLVGQIMQITGKKIKVIQEKERLRPERSEVERLKCDNSKIIKTCGWRPQVSFKEGLRQTCAWIKKNINRYKAEIYNV
ncbi:MAG TPA: NAD-dependent 4,6-dehydratase LegB [Candidatus Omnitrophota bacterium]|nr:NAD-dependent 4,6-dehydratase LegB [Candidatus Omnitrophota bacterium]